MSWRRAIFKELTSKFNQYSVQTIADEVAQQGGVEDP